MVNNKGLVRFHMLDAFALPKRQQLKAFIDDLMKKEKKPFASLDYIFCSDEYLLEINKAYLHHDELTDIITFDLSENKDSIAGEIYISIERIRENALLYKTSFIRELYRVMFHGALHLCGYKDNSSSDKALMRKMEDKYLSKYP